ncbi:hypothetical protein PAXRUDRAFT_832650 [Paxillus rubicundulus Ve08.2h10]|uniref:Uncharacterized protein n=1 Tax=Paxillus rubicundulus Ve08.2h10 TaxID=930991 RepID=A0A0D0DQM9_9AGAM|nr:hypothetical protein PAXRUDRAFT_832650 [Paxillus rubicundulus Ve08.2h10]
MIPVDRSKPNGYSQNQTPLANVSIASSKQMPIPAAAPAPPTVSPKPHSITPRPNLPLRPSTAPPAESSLASGSPQEAHSPGQSRTALLLNLRARNLLLQKAISHIDDAVLYLMAARSGVPSARIQEVRGEARDRKDLLDRVDRAIRMAQNGKLEEVGSGSRDPRGVQAGTGNERRVDCSFVSG